MATSVYSDALKATRDHNMDVFMQRQRALDACPSFRCEIVGCEHDASPNLEIATDWDGAKVDRYVCAEHWQAQRRLGVAGRDLLIAEWGWPGDSWYRD